MTGGTEAHMKDLMNTVNNANEGMAHKKPMIPDVPIHPGLILRPPPKPIRSTISANQQTSHSLTSTGDTNINSNINIEFKEKLTISGRHYFRKLSKTQQIILPRTQRVRKLINTDSLFEKFYQNRQTLTGI